MTLCRPDPACIVIHVCHVAAALVVVSHGDVRGDGDAVGAVHDGIGGVGLGDADPNAAAV